MTGLIRLRCLLRGSGRRSLRNPSHPSTLWSEYGRFCSVSPEEEGCGRGHGLCGGDRGRRSGRRSGRRRRRGRGGRPGGRDPVRGGGRGGRRRRGGGAGREHGRGPER
ncbi:hypothetical protein DEJ44_26325 [Streptomyces venezuelae]|nr:hypothetical protein DEJ44_26325 [Streptomyces venezuelae]